MPFDSVFAAALEVPFADDLPLIPIADIEQGLDAIENASIEQQTRILAEQTANLLERSAVFLQARDVAGIQSLEWNAGVALQAPIFSVWSMGWQLGSAHMIREMVAAVPAGLKQEAEGRRFGSLLTPHSSLLTFATAQEKDAIAALLQLQPGTIVNTAAEQAVLRRVVQLSGNFSEAQLAKLKVSLIGAISPDADGKVLSRKQLLDQVQANLKVGKARAEAIARTELTNAYNSSRIQTALQSSMVTHFRFLAISDARTTPICRSRNGMLIAASDLSAIAANKPPLHVRCRSTISPVMSGINPTHAEWVADPQRDWQQRTLEPLPKGWNGASAKRSGIEVLSSQSIDKTRQIARAGGRHGERIERGKAFLGQLRMESLDPVPTKRLIQLKESLAKAEIQLDHLWNEIDDAAKVFETPIGKQFTALKNAVAAEQKKQSAGALQTMEQIRADLITSSPLTTKKVKALVDTIKISKGAARTLEAAQIRSQLEEFFKISGGRGSTTLKSVVKKGFRAHAEAELINIGGNKATAIKDLWHEAAHHLETESKDLIIASRDWVKARSTGEQVPLRRLTNLAYQQDEKAYPDHFFDPYVGKLYSDGSEVVSMGMQSFTDPESMLKFYRQDPEHFFFLLGLIR